MVVKPTRKAPQCPSSLTGFEKEPGGGGRRERLNEKTRALFDRVSRLLQKTSFPVTAKQRPQDFTRQRKMGFLAVWSVIVNPMRRSSQLEWDAFRRSPRPPEVHTTTDTKPSLAEARQTLLPEAFTRWNDAVVPRCYADDDDQTFHGLRIRAIDGSVMALLNTPALRTA